ncbi:MAG: cation-translocating P-type ATPase, partial [Pricia sp.]|nr:cation-translocating P-type ATPase [Pricia sp.]
GFNEPVTRTMVFMVLIVANIFLTLVNRSFYFSVLTTLKYRNNLVPLIISVTVAIAALLLFVPSFTAFFKFQTLNLNQLMVCILAGSISVLWYEVVKWRKRKRKMVQRY